MANKTIITTVTVHQPHPKDFRAPKYNDAGGVIDAGNYAIVAVPPGKPATLESDEADALLAKFGGEEVKPAAKEPPAAPAK
jgi:hypothetical protein